MVGAAYSDTQTEAALALYNQKNYASALAIFLSISANKPDNPQVLYYAANCQIGLGKTSAALSLYREIVQRFPHSAEANSAQSILRRLGANTVKTFAGESKKVSDDSSQAPSTSTGQRISKSSRRSLLSAEKKEVVIDNMVVKVRAQADRPEVSDTAMRSVKLALKYYPTPLLNVLYVRGCKIYVTPTMIDKEPQLTNRQPAGYEDGATFRNCPGMFNGNVVLCEKEFVGDGPELKNTPDIVGTLRHELGHAVDWYLGSLTSKDDFKHQYLLDLGGMSDDLKNQLAYFCQKDRRGPAETFAELMCLKYGGRPKGSYRTELVGESFKRSRAYVDKTITAVALGENKD
jgi:hypothetical protein